VTLPRLLLLLFTTNLVTFGNGRVMVPILERALVETTGALSLEQFLYAFTVGRVTPGPANVYVSGIGYMLYGWTGAALVVLVIMAPAYLVLPLHAGYRRFEGTGAVRGFARGLTAASVGLLIAATFDIGQTTLTSPSAVVVCLAAVLMLNVARWNTLVSLALACALGLALTRLT
jgi:chromate transport protein ChrA